MDSPAFKPHSCRHCADLGFYLSYDDVKRGEGPLDALGNFAFKEQTLRFPTYTVSNLLEAAGGGCSFAQVLLNGKEMIFNQLSQMEDTIVLSVTLVRLPGSAKIDTLNVGFSAANSFLCNCPGRGNHSHGKNDIFERTKISLLVYASSENPASKFILNRPVNVRVSSEDTFRLAHGWLKECHESHPDCRKPDPQYKPTRLIEIITAEDQDIVSATEFNKPKAYTALSYCWGGNQTFTATKETLSDLVHDIPLQKLPKTIEDAVITTHKLGIRFLWVDSLCIIQDDDEDKGREIPEMPKIYGNSSVTIIAARASHVGEGFLQDRDVTGIHAGSSEVPYRGPDDMLGSIVLCRELEKKDEPLDERAWTLQESLLSPRILEYGTYKVSWICPTATHDDGWKEEKARSKRDKVLDKIISSRAETAKLKIKRGKVSGSWRSIIASYTSRSLTIPADRMRAISGVAERYGTAFNYQYIAGLWTSDLPGSLLWKIRRTLDDPPYYQPQPRPKTYGYPSWSWVSVPGPVSIPEIDDKISEARLKITKYSCRFVSVVNSEYGDIDLGELTVSCRLLPATYKIPALNSSDEPTLTLPESSPKDGVLDISAVPDAVEEEASEENATTIPVYILEVSSPLSYCDKVERTDVRYTMSIVQTSPDSETELSKGGFRTKRRRSLLYDSTELSGLGLILRKLDTGMYSRLGIYKMCVWKGRNREEVQSQEEVDQLYPFTNCATQTIILV
ncbi:hypothetical protein LARI1_G006171 [Lachnellula arida]|uniref:Heterokaryon incompatibility domain-containing protein n=1 Tax=Lachnellula arida TaxID=1316785 RepID=A0A8T9BDH1_9HELO|nr:hypothetical protein LARI1_G006171 [Lachnellula arida]